MRNAPISAIDIGSNAIRMIIGQVQKNHLQIIKKIRAPVRIGHDVFQGGLISEGIMQEAELTFQEFKKLNQEWGVQQCRAVATSAVREAKNKKTFIDRVYKKSQIKIETIDGIEEARLIHLAVQREVDFSQKRILLIDVGGGSVEVSFSENGMMSATQSFPMGTVRMLQKLKQRQLNEKGIKVILGEFLKPLNQFLESHLSQGAPEWAVGTGGNLECMGKLKLQVLKKTPDTLVSLQELGQIADELERYTIRERVSKLSLRPDRADVILPAILLVKTILRQAEVPKILIPGVGLRNGLLWSLKEQEVQI